MIQLYNDTWISADESVKNIKDMHSAYISNCIRKLEKYCEATEAEGNFFAPVLAHKLVQLRQELQNREIESLKNEIRGAIDENIEITWLNSNGMRS